MPDGNYSGHAPCVFRSTQYRAVTAAINMDQSSAIASHVDASCELLRLPLSAEQRQRVIDTFARTAALIAPLLDISLAAETEPASVFIP